MLNFIGKKDVQILEGDLILDFVREEWTVEPPALSNELFILEGNHHSDSQHRTRIGFTITIYFFVLLNRRNPCPSDLP